MTGRSGTCLKLRSGADSREVATLVDDQVGVWQIAAAFAHGLAVALPTKVAVARPTGVGRAITAYDMPIESRDEWLAAARRLA